MFIRKLLPHTTEKTISHWQIAADGIWEEAKEIRLQPTPEEIEKLVKWVSSSPKDIAIEAFFGDKDQDFFFLGIRIESMSKASQVDFIAFLLGTISKKYGLAEIVKTLQEALKSSFVLESDPILLELGAEGFWKSYGSYVVWKKGQNSPASVEKIKKEAPQLLEPFERAIMIEFAWNEPLPMWLGIPISQKNNGSHQFSKDRYAKISGTVL